MRLILAAFAAALLPAASAAAQIVGVPAPQLRQILPTPPGAPERRDCAPGTVSDEIVVCGRRESDERHRLPLVRERRFDPHGPIDSVSRERNRLLGPPTGSLGACSIVGPNGMSGCHALGVWKRREQQGH